MQPTHSIQTPSGESSGCARSEPALILPALALPTTELKEDLFHCFQAHLPGLAAWLRRLSFPPHIIQDASEAAEVVAIDAIHSGLAATMTIPARRKWLRVVLFRAAVTLCRRRQPMPLLGDLSDEADLFAGTEREAVLAALMRLSEEHRALLDLLYFDGHSLRSAAALLSMSEPAIRRHRDKALDALRTEMEKLEY
jgi:DNA-directed RNA polymerase specialized sigma24 family protein